MSDLAIAINKKPIRISRIVLHAFLITVAAAWILPLAWAVINSFRDYGYTS